MHAILRQHRRASGGEFIDGGAVAPAEGFVPYFSGDANNGIVVCNEVPRLSGPRAMLPFSCLLPLIPPSAIRDVIERRFLGLRARPAVRQMRADVRIHDRGVA